MKFQSCENGPEVQNQPEKMNNPTVEGSKSLHEFGHVTKTME